jgi:hypothetical protein
MVACAKLSCCERRLGQTTKISLVIVNIASRSVEALLLSRCGLITLC